MFAILGRSRVQPSFRDGFARCAAESVAPELWDGLANAWIPALGCQGGKLWDVAGKEHLTPSGGFGWNNYGLSITAAGGLAGIYTTVASATFTLCVSFVPRTGGYATAQGRLFAEAGGNTAFLMNEATGINSFTINARGVLGTTANIFIANAINTVCVSGVAGILPLLYINGKKYTATQTTNGLANEAIRFGNSTTARTFDGTFSAIMISYNAFAGPQLQQLSADPLLPFRRRTPVFYSIPSAAGFKPGWYRKPVLIGGGIV